MLSMATLTQQIDVYLTFNKEFDIRRNTIDTILNIADILKDCIEDGDCDEIDMSTSSFEDISKTEEGEEYIVTLHAFSYIKMDDDNHKLDKYIKSIDENRFNKEIRYLKDFGNFIDKCRLEVYEPDDEIVVTA